MSFVRNSDLIPMEVGRFCLLIDDSQGGSFPEALYDENVMRPAAGIYRIDKVAAKTFTGIRFSRQGEVAGEISRRMRRELVVAVFDTLEQTVVVVDHINALGRHAKWQEDITRKQIHIQTRNDILSLLPMAYTAERNAA
ncbi:hypothetical protein [Brucella pseudogrignonensis]|uniref:hypothetical protein n=1 Tax=Brucella pseudogrignonensis TaxID=419475 RepID=UPI000CFB09BB|nr:hypothetical protein [Brucella pseudogrignonensis]MQP40943.1 hypothetical protein [Ochrobactrum sp. MYb237]PQZ40898.1 hypothetical protein CQ059_16740 [Brucella pseudogrignonensis]PRA40383.1 hypothetical protein CQ063_12415 [Brucella pseudogrignonensis]PRA68976.1 hypothetical protein CQ055_12300 [Brucella pseudogrignonensis]